MNDFIDAIKNNKSKDEGSDDGNPSSERYSKLKQEEAGVDNETPAEKRFNALKEEAKNELKKAEAREASEQEKDEKDEDPGFVTH